MLAAQPGLFDTIPSEPATPSPESIRERLDAFLSAARSAERMPWTEQRARVIAILFHQMANWLPKQEREAIRTAFADELARLRAAR